MLPGALSRLDIHSDATEKSSFLQLYFDTSMCIVILPHTGAVLAAPRVSGQDGPW